MLIPADLMSFMATVGSLLDGTGCCNAKIKLEFKVT